MTCRGSIRPLGPCTAGTLCSCLKKKSHICWSLLDVLAVFTQTLLCRNACRLRLWQICPGPQSSPPISQASWLNGYGIRKQTSCVIGRFQICLRRYEMKVFAIWPSCTWSCSNRLWWSSLKRVSKFMEQQHKNNTKVEDSIIGSDAILISNPRCDILMHIFLSNL